MRRWIVTGSWIIVGLALAALPGCDDRSDAGGGGAGGGFGGSSAVSAGTSSNISGGGTSGNGGAVVNPEGGAGHAGVASACTGLGPPRCDGTSVASAAPSQCSIEVAPDLVEEGLVQVLMVTDPGAMDEAPRLERLDDCSWSPYGGWVPETDPVRIAVCPCTCASGWEVHAGCLPRFYIE